MKNIFLFLTFIIVFTGCDDKKFHLKYEHESNYYINKSELPELEIQQDVYVSAYSDIYYETEDKRTYLTVILSLRNISFTDSIYFDKIDYYDSNGKLIRKYLNNILVLRPMESMEYIVRADDKEGGAGANFVVGYQAKANLKNPPFIEAVMMGNIDNYRFSFSSPGVPINQ